MHFGVGLLWKPSCGIFSGGGVSFLPSSRPPPGTGFGLVDIFLITICKNVSWIVGTEGYSVEEGEHLLYMQSQRVAFLLIKDVCIKPNDKKYYIKIHKKILLRLMNKKSIQD